MVANSTERKTTTGALVLYFSDVSKDRSKNISTA